MKITLLGTGAALPSTERLQSGIHLASGSDDLLVDCGSGVVHRLKQAGIDPVDVETVLLTHHHLDHVADLPTLFKARILSDCPHLRIVGPPGTERICEHLFAVDDLASRGEAHIREYTIAEAPFALAGFDIAAAATTHGKPCFGYRFGDNLVVSGDTAPDDDVVALADGTHTLVHDCSFPDEVSTESHTTPSGLGEGLVDIDIERVVLTHFFPAAEAQLDRMRSTVSEAVDASVLVGRDGLQLEFPD